MNGRAFGPHGPQRRRVLAGGLAALGAGIAGGVAAPALALAAAESAELRRLAAQKGLLYGTTISAAQITHDPAFVALVLRQAALVVPENDMKWQDINQGAPGDDDYSRADTVAGFAVEGGLGPARPQYVVVFSHAFLVLRPAEPGGARARGRSTASGRWPGAIAA